MIGTIFKMHGSALVAEGGTETRKALTSMPA